MQQKAFKIGEESDREKEKKFTERYGEENDREKKNYREVCFFFLLNHYEWSENSLKYYIETLGLFY